MKIFSDKYLIGICLTVLCTACFNSDDYINIDPDRVIKIVSNEGTTIADGISSFEVKAEISKKAVPDKRKVVFKTNLGFFKGGKGDSIVIDIDDGFLASADLVSLKEGDATVSAKILEITAKEKIKIKFDKAYPEIISVSVDSFSIANNFKSETIISATLGTSNGGKPSIGYQVNFIVKDQNNKAIGAFLNNNNFGFSDSEGKAKIRYSAGEIDQEGFLTITAKTLTQKKDTISADTRIFLSKKNKKLK